MRSSRTLALALTATLVIVVLAVVVKATAAPQQTPAKRAANTAQKKAKKQQGVQTATLIAEATLATWNCQDKLVALGLRNKRDKLSSPWRLPKSEKYRRWVLHQRTHKHTACLKILHRRAYEWNWQAFPPWIIQLARCESSLNWWAEGSSRDGVFYSAFNISRSVYDKDAHHMGVRGWHEGTTVPSPYEQAMAVIGHIRLYGDGFTGRCHGIAHSTWN